MSDMNADSINSESSSTSHLVPFGIVDLMRAALRFALFLFLVTGYFSCAFLILICDRIGFFRTRRQGMNCAKYDLFTKNTSLWAGWGLKVLDVRISRVGYVPPPGQAYLHIANHLGFLDVLATSVTKPICFVTSVEIKQTPVLGQFCEMGGSLFVERRSRNNILNERKEIEDALKAGLCVALFPEATSTNGEGVLPFKRNLTMSAAYASVPVQPVVVNYKSINGKSFNYSNRDVVCWYGEMTFATNLINLFTSKGIHIELDYLPPVKIQPETDKALLAEKLHGMIADRFISVRTLP